MFYPETHTVPSYVISILPFSVSPSHATFPCSATAYRLHESFFFIYFKKTNAESPLQDAIYVHGHSTSKWMCECAHMFCANLCNPLCLSKIWRLKLV